MKMVAGVLETVKWKPNAVRGELESPIEGE